MASNEEILRRNKEIRDLQGRIAAPENKRTTVLEQDLQSAFQALSGVKATKKQYIIDTKIPERDRKTTAIRLLELLIRKPWYGRQAEKYKEQIEEKEEKKEEAKTQAISQQQQAKATQKLAEDNANTGTTTRLAQTEETKRLAQQPTIDYTTRGLEETDNEHVGQPKPATGKTLVEPKTKQTVALQEGQAPPPPSQPVQLFTPAAPYMAAFGMAPIPVGLAKDPEKNPVIATGRAQIEANVKKKMEAVKKGAYGNTVLERYYQDTHGFEQRVRSQAALNVFGNIAQQLPEVAIAAANAGFAPAQEAVQRQTEVDKELFNEGLLDPNQGVEHDPLFQTRTRNVDGDTQVDRLYSRFDPDQVPSTNDLVRVAAPVRREFLAAYTAETGEAIPYNIQTPIFPSFSSISQRLGLEKKVARTGAKAVGATVVREGAKESFERVGWGQAVKGLASKFIGGVATGGASWIISLIPSAYKFIKRHAGEFAGAGVAITLLGGMVGSLFIGALGAGLVGLSVMGGGIGVILAGTGAMVAGVFGFMFSIVFSAIFLPIIISFVAVIALLAFILFIINNSGYVTPFSKDLITTDTTADSSLYIAVKKTPSPADTFANPQGNNQITVTYKIEVTALKQDLTNITFNNSYQITQQNQKATIPQTTLPAPPSSINSGDTYTFTYDVNYNSDFNNSLVCDTFEVSANASSTRDTAASTACVTIGTSPIPNECPAGWPVDFSGGKTYGITQGPNTTLTHPGEAVDVALRRAPRPDDYVLATHKGEIVNIVHNHPVGGNYLLIRSTCNGQQFDSYYGHMRNPGFAAGLTIGQAVQKGQRLGLVGKTGYAFSGEHVHYQFNGGLQMKNPYIPTPDDSLKGCIGFEACGSISLP